ncbi:Hypothetical protein A7982_06069 [Minicystis rosea]|nr:Hypothetical protein A7982_06069 [Minicystis rosea]
MSKGNVAKSGRPSGGVVSGLDAEKGGQASRPARAPEAQTDVEALSHPTAAIERVRGAATPSARDVLALQQTLGNRATRRILDGVVQRRVATASAAPAPTHGGRAALPLALRAGVERLSGVSLHDVRVHYDSAAPARFDALAYTHGSEIHVAPGQERYLPHEAWHAAQQKLGRVRPTSRMASAALNTDPALEREADIMGARAAREPMGDRVARGYAVGDIGAAPVQRVSATPVVQCGGTFSDLMQPDGDEKKPARRPRGAAPVAVAPVAAAPAPVAAAPAPQGPQVERLFPADYLADSQDDGPAKRAFDLSVAALLRMQTRLGPAAPQSDAEVKRVEEGILRRVGNTRQASYTDEINKAVPLMVTSANRKGYDITNQEVQDHLMNLAVQHASYFTNSLMGSRTQSTFATTPSYDKFSANPSS